MYTWMLEYTCCESFIISQSYWSSSHEWKTIWSSLWWLSAKEKVLLTYIIKIDCNPILNYTQNIHAIITQAINLSSWLKALIIIIVKLTIFKTRMSEQLMMHIILMNDMISRIIITKSNSNITLLTHQHISSARVGYSSSSALDKNVDSSFIISCECIRNSNR